MCSMKMSKKMAQQFLEVLEGIKREFFQEEEQKYPLIEWEEKRLEVRERIQYLSDYIEKAASLVAGSAGCLEEIEVSGKVRLLLFEGLMKQENRDEVEIDMGLELFGGSMGFEVGDTFREDLHSDVMVKSVVYHVLLFLLQGEEPSGNSADDKNAPSRQDSSGTQGI